MYTHKKMKKIPKIRCIMKILISTGLYEMDFLLNLSDRYMMAEIGLFVDNVSMVRNQSSGGSNGSNSDSFVTFDMVLI